MRSHVRPQIARMQEGLVADAALGTLLARVLSHVNGQVALGRIGFVAYFTACCFLW